MLEPDPRSAPVCRLCAGEGREDTDDGWTVVCRRCHGTGLKATPTERNT
jgi:hypothetical protein